MTIAVIILTYNEEIHLERALLSVASFADEVFVVDSYSKDRTVEVARANGATVLQRVFDNQARQFNWALDTLDIHSAWIMRLDADEIIEPDLAEAIRRDLPRLPVDVVGVNLNRKHIFLGRWIRHGGRYPVVLLRLWRRGHGRVEDRWMDEHVVISGGRTVTLEGGFADHNLNDITYFIDKHNKYATREAVEVIGRRHGIFDSQSSIDAVSASRQAAIKRWIKEKIYVRLPFGLGPFAYFTFRMTVQLGFLDGREGLIYHFLQGFWYRFLVGAKIVELERGLAGADGASAVRSRLRQLTGLNI
ncbi:glycosyltransferase family 2 protein [Nevskia sp.]|uniref:glycosyltransferase family 2 protein n=1 Tax=Nevskia sp. TaxID=1929292 RepID=UPI0025FA1BDD|nr:glycosyltransferase family 2 protein [Nevskia sp.]